MLRKITKNIVLSKPFIFTVLSRWIILNKNIIYFNNLHYYKLFMLYVECADTSLLIQWKLISISAPIHITLLLGLVSIMHYMSYNIASSQLYFLCAMHFSRLLHHGFIRTIKKCSEKAKLFMKVKGKYNSDIAIHVVVHIQLKQ